MALIREKVVVGAILSLPFHRVNMAGCEVSETPIEVRSVEILRDENAVVPEETFSDRVLDLIRDRAEGKATLSSLRSHLEMSKRIEIAERVFVDGSTLELFPRPSFLEP